MKLLIIDDDADIRDSLRVTLALQWPDALMLEAADGLSGIALAEREIPDLIILDVMMPEMDGFEVCARLRRSMRVPILMLTVMGRTVDKVQGLEAGADDFVVKPFDHIELIARVKALLRRAGLGSFSGSESTIETGLLRLDRNTRLVTRDERSVKLTSKEEAILNLLIRNRGRTVQHRALLANVWGSDFVNEKSYLKLFIHNLRRKLASVGCPPKTIATERGLGYRFTDGME